MKIVLPFMPLSEAFVQKYEQDGLAKRSFQGQFSGATCRENGWKNEDYIGNLRIDKETFLSVVERFTPYILQSSSLHIMSTKSFFSELVKLLSLLLLLLVAAILYFAMSMRRESSFPSSR